MRSPKRTRAGRAVLLVVAGVVALTTVLAGTGAAAKSNLYYVNVGAAAFVPESSGASDGIGGVSISVAPTSAKLQQQQPLGCPSYDHDGYSGALVDGDGCTYVAHIDLPDGMRIGSITAYYNDGGGPATFHFEANNDTGSHTDLVADNLDGSAGDEGGAVCDGSDNCSAIWDLNERVNNNTTHYGIWLPTEDDDGGGFILYRFKIKLKSG